MTLRLISLALLIQAILATSAMAAVVINEVELDASGNDSSQWIELYNTEDFEVDISSWSIEPLSDRSKEEFIEITNISAKGFYVISFDDKWMDPSEETLILKDESGNVVDRTPILYDYYDSDCVWGRYPDGSNIWLLLVSSEGKPSLGELCEEEETREIRFSMDQRVEGSGYANIRNALNKDKESLMSRESGSGIYMSEEASRYSADLNGSAYAMDLKKNNLSVRYADTTFSVNPQRSIKHASKWSESSSAYSSDYESQAPSLCESHTDLTRMDSDVTIHYRNFELGARISSDYDGIGRIKSNLTNFRAEEEYAGSFNIENDYSENISNEIRISVAGEGFVSTDKKLGNEDNTDYEAYTYEKGTGIYDSEELIDASDISTLNLSRVHSPDKTDIFLAKDVSLRHAPVNRSYARVMPVPMSISWREGTGSQVKEGAFMSSDFSDLSEFDSETLILSSTEAKTSASFTGRARLKAGYINQSNLSNSSDHAPDMVYIDEEYVGNFSITRGYKAYPELTTPHLSLRSQGFIDGQDCSRLRYVITLVNDGNRPLGPIFVRTSFPTGTSYLDSSVRPFELSSRYANWSISYLSIGNTANINLDLLITARRDNYTTSSRAVTVYPVIRSYPITDSSGDVTGTFQTSSDRRLSASNSSKLESDWSACESGNLSIALTATPNSRQPRLLTYRLALENLGQENLSANITVTLPAGISFINSTSRQENISADTYCWFINRLDAGKRRSITFMAIAKDDGFYTSNASIVAYSRDDGRKIALADVTAPVIIGKTVYSITPTYWQDWCPCDENLLGRLSWNETSVKSGKDLGCLCGK